MGAFMAPIINLSMVQNQFQYIIIGAGCAGLQLAKALLEQSSDLVSSILLIDAEKAHQEAPHDEALQPRAAPGELGLRLAATPRVD